jgi:hypothetical protein
MWHCSDMLVAWVKVEVMVKSCIWLDLRCSVKEELIGFSQK